MTFIPSTPSSSTHYIVEASETTYNILLSDIALGNIANVKYVNTYTEHIVSSPYVVPNPAYLDFYFLFQITGATALLIEYPLTSEVSDLSVYNQTNILNILP